MCHCLDNIIVGSLDTAEHDANLKKATFTEEDLKADPTKTEAINKTLVPEDISTLQQFLGMVNYLGKYIPNLSELTTPEAAHTQRQYEVLASTTPTDI